MSDTKTVYVLAVMDLAYRHLNGGGDSLSVIEHKQAHAGMKEARAAVEELMKAAESYAYVTARGCDKETVAKNRKWLRAALARVGGVK